MNENEKLVEAQKLIQQIKESDDKHYRHKYSLPYASIRHMIRTSVSLYGERTAFMQRFEKGRDFKKISYNEMYADMNALGTALIARGFKDKRIAVIGRNSSQWAISYLAVVCGCGVVVPLDKELPQNEIEQLCIAADVEAVFADDKHFSTMCEIAKKNTTHISLVVNTDKKSDEGVFFRELIDEGRKALDAGDTRYVDAPIDCDAMSVLLFTSGTTGISKGVMLSHYNICFILMTAPNLLYVDEKDLFFSVLPIHHTYECTCGFLMPLTKGAGIVFCEGLKYIQKNMQETHPTLLLCVPAILDVLYTKVQKSIAASGKSKTVERIIKADRITSKFGINLKKRFFTDIYAAFGGSLRVIITGGAPVAPEKLKFFNDLGYICVQGYGLTECSPLAGLNPDSAELMKNSSAGHIMPCTKAKIDSPDENGIGEICLFGDNVMLGYYNMPDETAEVIRDGWFHTGDLGYVDADNYIYITGRKKNVIITPNGKNVFPEELEHYLSAIPYVAESMVWSKKDENGHDGAIIATIKPDTDAIANAVGAEPDEAQIRELLEKSVDELNEGLPLFKQITRVGLMMGDFDKNTSQKIRRFSDKNKIE